MKRSRLLLCALLIIVMSTFAGCNFIDSIPIKLGLRNQDFDYIINDNVDKIIIQSSRDQGFRFIVTDASAIKDIYDILRSGNPKDKKTSLEPDYIVEVYLGDEVLKYNYVVNIDERDVGNFYSGDNIYDISNSLDQIITNNLSFIRKPKDFKDIYYKSIIDILNLKKDALLSQDNKVGIDIGSDVDCLKYMFSVDLKQFNEDIKEIIPSIELVQNNISDFDTVITVKNKGYSMKKFRTIILVDDKKNKSYETYYVTGSYKFKEWEIEVSEPNKKPENW